jgi:hypothetical protein
MPLDAYGIWQYEETEAAAPFSVLLNKLAGSVSAVVAPHLTDTGWVTIPTTLASPWTASLKARRIGKRVSWKGTVEPNSTNWGAINNSQTVVNNLLATHPEFVPVDSMPFILSSSVAASANVAFRAAIQSNGLIVIRNDQTNYAFGVNVVCDYLVD